MLTTTFLRFATHTLPTDPAEGQDMLLDGPSSLFDTVSVRHRRPVEGSTAGSGDHHYFCPHPTSSRVHTCTGAFSHEFRSGGTLRTVGLTES